jgi:hypothetical protein
MICFGPPDCMAEGPHKIAVKCRSYAIIVTPDALN